MASDAENERLAYVERLPVGKVPATLTRMVERGRSDREALSVAEVFPEGVCCVTCPECGEGGVGRSVDDAFELMRWHMREAHGEVESAAV